MYIYEYVYSGYTKNFLVSILFNPLTALDVYSRPKTIASFYKSLAVKG